MHSNKYKLFLNFNKTALYSSTLVMKLFSNSRKLLNQARAGLCAPGFLKLFRPRMLVYVCVSTPKAINNKSRERHS